MTTSPWAGFTELEESETIPQPVVVEMGRRIEAGAQFFIVEDKDENDPPAVVADGRSYIIAATASGDWTGHEGKIATAVGTNASNGWLIRAASEGIFAWVRDENKLYYHNGSAWAEYSVVPTLTLASTVTQSGTPVATSVGFLGSPQMSDQDAYTLALTDAGGHYYHVSGTPHTLTIPANASVAFPIGTVIAIVNEDGAGAITLAITSDTLRWTDQTGSRTIAENGTATLLKVTSTVWRLTGDGIT